MAPRLFFELAHWPVRDRIIRLGGGQRYFRFANYYLKKNKTLQRLTDTHLDPFWDHFGAATSRISGNFGLRKQIALVNAPNRFRNRSGCIFALGTRIGRFAELSHNQHPAGSHSKSRAGLFASSKKQAGRNKKNTAPVFNCQLATSQTFQKNSTVNP